MSEHLYTYDDPVNPKDIARIVKTLENDGVIAYPSDVNWGFMCDASSPKALDRIKVLKPYHPKSQPFSVLCRDLSMVSSFANLDQSTYRYIKKALPGPYTIVVERNKVLARHFKDNKKTIGFRIPDSKLVMAICEEFGAPLATTTVPNLNPLTSKPQHFDQGESETLLPLKFGYEVFEHFGHGLDFIVDLGEEVSGDLTTVISFESGSPELIRPGSGPVDVFGI